MTCAAHNQSYCCGCGCGCDCGCCCGCDCGCGAGAGACAGEGAPGTAGIGVGAGAPCWLSSFFLSLSRVFSAVVVFFFFFFEAVSPARPSGADWVCRSATSAASGGAGVVESVLPDDFALDVF